MSILHILGGYVPDAIRVLSPKW